jgi:hypothetical protein
VPPYPDGARRRGCSGRCTRRCWTRGATRAGAHRTPPGIAWSRRLRAGHGVTGPVRSRDGRRSVPARGGGVAGGRRHPPARRRVPPLLRRRRGPVAVDVARHARARAGCWPDELATNLVVADALDADGRRVVRPRRRQPPFQNQLGQSTAARGSRRAEPVGAAATGYVDTAVFLLRALELVRPVDARCGAAARHAHDSRRASGARSSSERSCAASGHDGAVRRRRARWAPVLERNAEHETEGARPEPCWSSGASAGLHAGHSLPLHRAMTTGRRSWWTSPESRRRRCGPPASWATSPPPPPASRPVLRARDPSAKRRRAASGASSAPA